MRKQKKFIKWFKEINKKSVNEAGGKGASLGEMTQARIPVPNGFVVLSSSFDLFIKTTNLDAKINFILEKVNPSEMSSIDEASTKIKKLILEEKMPPEIENGIKKHFKELDSVFVAVRSSATSEDSLSAAWAGQLDSFLNTKEDKLIKNVKKCWASLFTPRAIFYRFEKKLDKTKISVAVVIQKMVNSEKSGIAFTVHPVTQNPNQLIIEAGLGLGEAIVSGQITPDSYVIEKKLLKIIEKKISIQEKGLFRIEDGGNEWKKVKESGVKQKLSEKQVLELSKILLRIEQHYKFPCDIEWALEKNNFFIVQSRPITTLSTKPIKSKKMINDYPKKSEDDFNWTKNYLENNSFDVKEARFIYPVGDIMFTMYSKPNLFRDNYAPIFIPYANKKGKQIISEEKEKELERGVWRNAILNKQKFLGVLKEARGIQSNINKTKLSEEELKKISEKELLKYYTKLTKLILSWWKYASIGENKGLIVEEKLIPSLTSNHNISEEKAFEYATYMTTPLKESVFSEERINYLELCIKSKKNPDLIESKNKAYYQELTNYSKKYFYARTSFYDAIKLDEENLINLIKETINTNSLNSLKEEQKKLINSVKELKKKQLTLEKLLTLTKEEKNYLWYFTLMHSWQDERKVSMMTHFNYFYSLLKEIAFRNKLTYDGIGLLTLKEIELILRTKKVNYALIRERKKGVFFVYSKKGVLMFSGVKAKKLVKAIPSPLTTKNSFEGVIACKGNTKKVVGRVRIIYDPSKENFSEGEILVTTMTRPEFVPIMKKALAIITDEGGLTSHAAIVSRELGTPCIIGTKIATTKLRNGDKVEIETEKGVIKIIN